MKTPSPKRRQILDFIARFIGERGYAPSVRDVAEGCGISSSSVAQYHLNVLEEEGYIHRDREISRSIGLMKKDAIFTAVPVLGVIAAGEPIPVPSADTWTARPEESLELPLNLTRGLDKLYALRIRGTSMIDALIDDGDIVLMQSSNTAEDGEMVAVWLKDEQEVTLKKLYREPGRTCLRPANKLMEPIYCPAENVEIQGKVVGVLRTL
jgi:repressor LexA